MDDPTTLTEDQWRERLSPDRYAVLRQAATERAFTGEYNDSEDAGVYRCAGCGAELFPSDTKFHSGSGWPSFWAAAHEGAVVETTDSSHGMVRTEITCARLRWSPRSRVPRRSPPDRDAILRELAGARARSGTRRRRLSERESPSTSSTPWRHAATSRSCSPPTPPPGCASSSRCIPPRSARRSAASASGTTRPRPTPSPTYSGCPRRCRSRLRPPGSTRAAGRRSCTGTTRAEPGLPSSSRFSAASSTSWVGGTSRRRTSVPRRPTWTASRASHRGSPA